MKNDLRVEKRGEGIMRHQCICVEVALQVKKQSKSLSGKLSFFIFITLTHLTIHGRLRMVVRSALVFSEITLSFAWPIRFCATHI